MKPIAQTEHEIHPLLLNRWSPRSFKTTPIDNQIFSMLEAAKWAASARNEQPWRFIYASKTSNPDGWNKLFECLAEPNQVWVKNAPFLMATIVSKIMSSNQSENPTAMFDLGLAMGNFTIQAMSLEIYVHNMGGFSSEKLRSNFQISNNFSPVIMVAAGYLDQAEVLPEPLRSREIEKRSRKNLKEIAFDGIWKE